MDDLEIEPNLSEEEGFEELLEDDELSAGEEGFLLGYYSDFDE
jgi:hypothetical protein